MAPKWIHIFKFKKYQNISVDFDFESRTVWCVPFIFSENLGDHKLLSTFTDL